MKTRLVFLLMLLALVSHVALGEVEIVWGELLGALLTGGEVNELHATIAVSYTHLTLPTIREV